MPNRGFVMPSGRVIRPQELQRWGYNDYRGALGQIGQVDWRRAFRSWIIRQTENLGRRATENLQNWFLAHQRSRNHRFQIVEQLRHERRQNDRPVSGDGQNGGESYDSFVSKNNMGRKNTVYSSNLTGKIRATKKPSSIKYFKDVYETGGTVVGENVCFISHATFPLEKLLETACLALARALAAKVGVVYNDAADTTVPFGGDLAIYWRLTPASQGTVNTSTITAPQTLTGAGGAIRTLLRTVLDITTDGSGYDVCNRPNAVIDRIELKPSLSSTSPVVNMPICLDLHACKIHAICYNSLKVQNQSDSTPTSDDDNAFQVDAVPLVGKVYYGKGSYAVPRHMIGSQLMPIQTSSVEDTGIAVGATFDNPPTSFATATADWQLEPPDGKMFINCSKEGKYSIEPGQMTTNTLKKSIHMSVSKMLYEYALVSGNINKTSYKLQNYCMLAIEKAASIKPIRAVVAANETPKISLLYQLDQALYVYVQVNKPQVPILQRYLRQADQNVAAVIPV